MEINTESKQLRYGTTVIYSGKIGIIKSISKTDNINIQLLHDNTIITVKKDKIKIIPHNKKDLIKYKDIYYIIENISLNCNKTFYYINFVNSGFNKSDKNTLKINCIDKNIVSIDKKSQEKTISYLKFIDRYNSSMSYLNKKTGKIFNLINYKTADVDMYNLFIRCNLRISQLDKICNAIKKCQDLNIQIKFLQINPFNFITQDYQLISYDKAEKICKEYSLVIEFKIKLEKWTYDMFLREKNTFYLPRWLYNNEMKKFCVDRQENHTKFVNFIKTIIIEKNINNSIWVTTKYLLGIEKEMSDLMMELFYSQLNF